MKFLRHFAYAYFYLYALLPFSILYFLSDMTFYPVYYLLKYRRKTVRKNLLNAFPGKSLAEIIQIEKSFYRHFCDYIYETIKLLHISDKEISHRFKFAEIDKINELINEGRSVLLLLGHYGNWEWVTSITLWLENPSNIEIGQIYRPLKNKAFDAFLLNLRKRFNSVGIPKNETLRAIVKLKNQKKQFLIGFMSDQKPSSNNMYYWTTFLNQETSVLTGVERIARQHSNACVAYLDIQKVKRGSYNSRIEIITTNPQSADEFEITEKYIRLMEQTIVREPAYWLWTHNRWKYKHKDIA